MPPQNVSFWHENYFRANYFETVDTGLWLTVDVTLSEEM